MISGVGPTIEDLKARGIGILNGVTMGLPVNREQKRRYLKKHKSDKDASYCIYCKGNTLTLSDDYGDLVCELCGIVKEEKVIYLKPESYTTECTSGYCQVLEEKENEQ